MSEKCERCGKTRGDVRFYSEDDDSFVENMSEGYYCSSCIKKMSKEWWDIESSAYCDGNCDDCDDMDENGECKRDII